MKAGMAPHPGRRLHSLMSAQAGLQHVALAGLPITPALGFGDSWFKTFLSISYLKCNISLALNTHFLVLYFFKILIQVHALSSLKIVRPLRIELFLIKACALLSNIKVFPKSNIID